MKSKKAFKRLTKAEELLSIVLAQYSLMEKEVEASVSSARAAIATARDAIGKAVAKASGAKKKRTAVPTPAAKAKTKTAARSKTAKKTAAAVAKSKPVKAAKAVRRKRTVHASTVRVAAQPTPMEATPQTPETAGNPSPDAAVIATNA